MSGADHSLYGVYTGEEGGFYPENVVVVRSQRDGTTKNTLVRGAAEAESACGWCVCKSADTATVDSPWYRPAVLLVVIALLLVVFLLVSGMLVYYNRKYWLRV